MSEGYHIFVCNSFRLTGEPQGVCNRKRAPDLLQHLETEIGDRGINATITSAGCMKQCVKGPVMVVYPNNWWYGELDKDRLDTILDFLENDEPAKEMLLK